MPVGGRQQMPGVVGVAVEHDETVRSAMEDQRLLGQVRLLGAEVLDLVFVTLAQVVEP